MVMGIAAAIIPSRAAGVRKLVGQPGIDQGFQSLVHRRQANVRNAAADVLINLLCRSVVLTRTQIFEHGLPLPCEAPAGSRKRASKRGPLGLGQRFLSDALVHDAVDLDTPRGTSSATMPACRPMVHL